MFCWNWNKLSGHLKTQHHANLLYMANSIAIRFMLWSLVHSAKKSENLRPQQQDWSLGRYQISTGYSLISMWTPPGFNNLCMIPVWFLSDFQVISTLFLLPYLQTSVFKTHLINFNFQYSALSHWPFSNSLPTVVANGTHKRIVRESHMKPFRVVLKMIQYFSYTAPNSAYSLHHYKVPS